MSEFIWRHIGAWNGGTTHSVALSPNTTGVPFALAATNVGVFHSVDGGRTWARARDMAYAAARAVAYTPHDARVAYAGTQDGGLFRSGDAGASWQRLSSWSFGAVNALALSPNFVADQTLFAATPDGIFRSLDGGRSWQSASFGLLDAEVLCLMCAPDYATSEVVWAGSAAGGLYRSRNAGRAWREYGNGLADAAVQCLGYTASTLFAGTEGGGVFRSTDGAMWEACGLDDRQVNCLAVGDGVVLAGTDEGVFLSVDEGQSWQCPVIPVPLLGTRSGIGDTMAGDVVLTLVATPNGKAIAGCLTVGVVASADGGRTWQRPTTRPAAHVPPLVAQSPDSALFMFDAAGGAARSTDGGASWEDIRLDDGPIQCAVAGGTAQQPTVLAATARDVLKWHDEAGVFESLMAKPALGDGDAISALAVTQGGTLLIGTLTGTVAISVDDGIVWHTLTLPGSGAAIAIHLTPSGGLFVLRLAPAGDATFNAEVWQLPVLVLPVKQTIGDWRMIAALDALRVPRVCMTIEVTNEGERVVLAGQNVIAVATPADGRARTATLPDGTTVIALVAAHGCLFVATNHGVFASADDGLTWQSAGSDWADAPVVSLCADAHGLLAITFGGDVWRYGAAS